MVDWPVSDGQPQVFRLLGEAASNVRLTPSYIMVPQKSLTMVMGIGVDVKSTDGLVTTAMRIYMPVPGALSSGKLGSRLINR
jgi:hypothetical protein